MADNPVYDQALRWLAQRPYGVEELRRRLAERTGADHAVIEEALARCLELGFLDDATFARAMTRDRLEVRRQGVHRLRQELRRRGVAEEVITQAIDESEVDPVAVARELVQRRFGDDPPREGREWKRRADFLARRGFDGETIKQVLRYRDGDEFD